MSRHRTVREPSEFRPPPVRGSRFLATVVPVRCPRDAEVALAAIAAAHTDATHHAWAWVLHDGRVRCADAGEPSGSAGRPILAQIEGRRLHDVLVVVTRWFGGTKLGVGGLVRAYGGAAGGALDVARVVEVDQVARRVVVHAYADTEAVRKVIVERGMEVAASHFAEVVRLELLVPFDELEAISALLSDRTGGRVALGEEPLPDEARTLPGDGGASPPRGR